MSENVQKNSRTTGRTAKGAVDSLVVDKSSNAVIVIPTFEPASSESID
jgi:hypothetical protein